MALTFTMQQGDGFWICGDTPAEDQRFVMDEIFLSRGFTLRGPDDKLYNCEAATEVEIAPNVWVSDGHRLIVGKARVVFEAPRSIKILRDDLYHASPSAAA